MSLLSHRKTKILADFQICTSLPLIFCQFQSGVTYKSAVYKKMCNCKLALTKHK